MVARHTTLLSTKLDCWTAQWSATLLADCKAVRIAVSRVSLAVCCPASAACGCQVPRLQLMVASHMRCLQVMRQLSRRVSL